MRIGIYGGHFQSAEVGGGHTFEMNFLESLNRLETEHAIFTNFEELFFIVI